MGRVLSQAELAEETARLRDSGVTVALANGHFDLLHVGHVRYLAAAADTAERLIVAINDDPSVARLKGEGRPIVPAAERAELLAALEMVDYVTVFDGDTPGPLLARIRPDVHCKGTDYGTPENVPEFAIVQGYGGRTVLVGDPKDHSTTDIIAAVRSLGG